MMFAALAFGFFLVGAGFLGQAASEISTDRGGGLKPLAASVAFFVLSFTIFAIYLWSLT